MPVQLVQVKNLTPNQIMIGPYVIPPNTDPRTGGVGEIPLALAKSRLLSGERRFQIPPEVADMQILPPVQAPGVKPAPAKAAVPAEAPPPPLATLPGGLRPVEDSFGGKFFVVLSGVSWGYHGQGQTPTELSKALASLGHQVLYVHAGPPEHDADYPVPDGVQVFALAKVYGVKEVASALLHKETRKDVGTRVVDSIRAVAHAWCGGRGKDRAFTLVTNPLPAFGAIAYELRLRSKFKTVYQCFDDWTGFVTVSQYTIEELGDDKYTDEELRLAKSEADFFVASSPALQNKLIRALEAVSQEGKVARVPLIRNGFVPDHFPTEHEEEVEVPQGLVLGSPTIVYWGCMVGEWFDWDLILRVASEIPDAEINLIGTPPTEALLFNRTRRNRMPRNVHFVGFVPHEDLWKYGMHSEIGIVPFKPSALSEAVSPLKAYEYLACRLPVIATGVPEVAEMPASFVAENHDEFIKVLTKTYEGIRAKRWPTKRVGKFLAESTWEKRAQALLDHLLLVGVE